MELLLALTVFLAISLAPVTLGGPIAALVLVSAAKKKKLSRFHLFWLLIINMLLLAYIIGMHGHSIFGPGDIALCSIPVSILITLLILNASKKEVLQLISDDLQQQKYYDMGQLLLPVLQGMILFFIFVLAIIGAITEGF